MTARVVVEGGVTVVEGGTTVVFGDDAPPAIASGFEIYRNGINVPILWDNHQLTSISLAMATSDAQVGMGSMTVPGDPGWVAGDRITFLDDLSNVLYTGYVMDHSRSRNPAALTEVETTYQLMDVNRQLIGRKVVDWVRPDETSLARLQAWLADFMPDTGALAINLDLSYLYAFGGAMMPAKTYTGDGIMDLLADLIRYTGFTLFMTISQVENTFEVHYSLAAVPLTEAGIRVTDVIADIDNIDVWGISDPSVHYSAADMKNDVTGRNGTAQYGFANGTSVTSHNAGGLLFQAVVNEAVDFVDLQILVNNILDSVSGAAEEKSTYTLTIRNLAGSDLIRIPPGCYLLIESDVFDLSAPGLPILHETLTVAHDVAGNPLPGKWDLALELASALRHPAAVRGYGGQGGSLGALSEDFSIADHVNVTYPDQLPPVGVSMIVPGQVVDDIERAVLNKDVAVNWTLEAWQDEAETVPSTAWSLDDVTTYTDDKGVALIILSHDNDGDWVKVRPVGTLA